MKSKSRKVPGWDKITAEHLKYCGPIATAAITWLINSITGIEKILRYFKKGLIVPIPKSNKDCTIRDNNRGITPLPIFYKLFENVLLERESEWLKQQQVTSDLQGAGQQHCSSLHTSLLVQEAIVYNVNKGESVYVGLLDTKKAFDTVWVNGLIYKLHDLGMHVKTWRLIKDGYNEFNCAAYIGGKPGEWFVAKRGVHQGAPFSMKLYQVFVNELLLSLRGSQHGITVGDIDLTCPTFADDIAIIALYKSSLNHLLYIAYDYIKNGDSNSISINVRRWYLAKIINLINP